MRFLPIFLMILPAFGQQPAEQAKPDAQTSPAAATPPADQAPAAKSEDKAAASAAPSTESWINGSVDFGYRWVPDVVGNFQQYRSVVNLGEGPKLFGFDLTLQDPKKRLYDTLMLRGMGFGGEPYTTANLDARKMKWYELRADYRNIAYFNAVPSFANPSAP